MLETLLLALELLVRTGALAALLLREARLCCRKLSMIETSSWASASLASMICTIRSGSVSYTHLTLPTIYSE